MYTNTDKSQVVAMSEACSTSQSKGGIMVPLKQQPVPLHQVKCGLRVITSPPLSEEAENSDFCMKSES